MKRFLPVILTVLVLFVSGCNKAEDIRQISSSGLNSDSTPSASQDINESAELTLTPKLSETEEPVDTVEPTSSATLSQSGEMNSATPASNTPKPSTPKPSTPKPSSPKPSASSKPSVSPKVNEHIYDQPIFLVNSININPKHVYYKDSYLYMEAFVSNGFNHTVFNLRDIYIKLSNKEGVIAEDYFTEMKNAVIGPNSYITWTFIFPPQSVKVQNADLGYLHTECRSTNSY